MRLSVFRSLIGAVLLLFVAGNVWADEGLEGAYHSRRVLVKFKNHASGARLNHFAQRNGLKLDRVIPRVDVFRFTLSGGQKVGRVVRRLNASRIVEFAEPDYLRFSTYIPTDPLFPMQWDMTLIGLPAAWDIEKGDASVVNAVLDTGIDLDHPDLVNQLWVNADEIPANGVDDDANGYVDDYNGYDFAGDGWFPSEGAEDPIPEDTYVGHGTHVSGTIAAEQDNGQGISGEAPGARLMAVRVLGGILGIGYSSDIVEGIIYATDNGARVINMSLGGTGKSLSEYLALKHAWDNNVFMAAAAGNDGDSGNLINYPAGYVFTMSVGATDSSDVIAAFSTHNEFVEVSAPGVEILSTVPGGGYESTMWSGTSMATPHVAGLAALLYSTYTGIENWQVRSMLQAGVVDLGAPGWDEFYGHGRADVPLLLSTLVPPPDVLQILTPPDGVTFRSGALVAVLWNPVTGAASYRIIAEIPGGRLKVIDTTDPYYTVSPSQYMPAGAYTVTVEALASDSSVISSDTVTFNR